MMPDPTSHAQMIAAQKHEIVLMEAHGYDDFADSPEAKRLAAARAVLAALAGQRSCVQWIEGVEGVLRRVADYLGDVEKSDEPDAPPSQLLAEIWTALNLLPLEPIAIDSAPRDGSDVVLDLGHLRVRAFWCNDLKRWVLCRPLHMESVHEPKGWFPPSPETPR